MRSWIQAAGPVPRLKVIEGFSVSSQNASLGASSQKANKFMVSELVVVRSATITRSTCLVMMSLESLLTDSKSS